MTSLSANGKSSQPNPTATPNGAPKPLYNSRITTVYVEYLDRHYPEINIDRLLTAAGMTRLQLEDQAHWFSQEQVDRFNQLLVRETGDPHISRAVGRFAASSERLGAIKKYILGFINPASVYLLFGRYHALASHGASIESRRIGADKVEIIATPRAGVKEQPYQCENRMGTIESIGTLVTSRFATVAHPECLHRGDAACRYEVSWEKSLAFRWERGRKITLILAILLAAGTLVGLPTSAWPTAMLSIALLATLVCTWAYAAQNKDLTRTILAQGDIAQEHLSELHTRYNNNLLIQEIGKAAATAQDENKLFEAVVAAMKSRLDFDRGLLLLADQNRTILRYAAGYGFDAQKREILRFVNFNLNRPGSNGLFVRSFHEQIPFIVDDIHGLKKAFSARSQRLIESFGAHSLICVPIIFEQESLGILAVDTITSRRKLLQTDLNLLMGIASHLAVSINNARSYQKLRRSEEKYRDIFENVSDYLYTHDLDGHILEANIAFQEAVGFQGSDLCALSMQSLLPNRYQERFEEYMRTMEATGHAEGITRIRGRKGADLVVEYKNSLVRDGDRPIGIRGSARDITERWQARREKKQLERMLERARKMEAVGTLAGGVAHDLNNILSGVVSYPELLLMDLPPDSPLRKPIKTIQESGQKAAAIVQDLLTMARRGVAITEVISINDVVATYLNSPECAKLKAFHPEVIIQAKPADRVLNLMGSSLHLFKTLMNLISNAAEAMPEGGTVTIASANQYVDQPIDGYDVVAEGDYVVLTVTDTGTGISEEDQKRIFEPFYTKKVMGRSGTGLGMSVVWATVKDHHGYIDIESKLGRGTTVALYFPASRVEARTKALPRSPADYCGHGETVLVVDDITEQREIAADILGRLGYRVATVPSGETALTYLETNKVHLVVLDMIMPPGMDGLDTYRRILDLHPQQKAIIASGFSESDRVKQAQRLGAGAYIKKPYVMETIGMAVQAELNA